MYNEVAKIAQEHGLTIERNLIGNYITSLEMQGCSITLVKLDDEMVRYWDAPVNTPALRWGVLSGRLTVAITRDATARLDEPVRRRDVRAPRGARRTRHGDRRRRPRDEHEPRHDQGDREARRRGAGRSPAPCSRPSRWRSSRASAEPPARCTGRCSCRWATRWPGSREVDLPAYAAAWRKGLEGVQARGKAQPEDKTMVDALIPAVEALEACVRSRRRPARGGAGRARKE